MSDKGVSDSMMAGIILPQLLQDLVNELGLCPYLLIVGLDLKIGIN